MERRGFPLVRQQFSIDRLTIPLSFCVAIFWASFLLPFHAHALQELYASPLNNDANLVQYDRFEGSINYTTEGINGTVGGGSASYTTGEFGDAWNASGTNWVSLGTDPSAFQITGNKTIVAWIKTSQLHLHHLEIN